MAGSPFTPEFDALLQGVSQVSSESGDAAAVERFYRGCIELGQEQRLNNLYHCKDKQTKRKAWFRMNAEQLHYLRHKTLRDAILKARQLGFTELAVKIGVDNCLFVPGSSEGLMADKKEKAVAELFQRVRDTLDWFAETWGALIPVVEEKNDAKKVILETVAGTAMKTVFEVSADFRGRSLTRLHCSEAARIKKDLLQAAHDAVPERGQIVHETTAKGRGGTFYKNWQETKRAKKKGEIYVWETHFFPWFHHYPEAGTTLTVPQNPRWTEIERYLMGLGATELALVWRRWKILENFKDEEEKFDEEYPSDDKSCFLGGSSVVPKKYLDMLDRRVEVPKDVGHIFPKGRWLEFVPEATGYVSVWEKPVLAEQYVIGVDSSEGTGKDRAAAYVKRRSNGEYVARIWGQLYPEELAESVYLLAIWYHNAHLCVESNNHGHVVIDRIARKYNYTNFYHRRELDEILQEWKDEIGFQTTRNSKDRIVTNMVARLREGRVHPHDDDLVTELTNFERDGNGRLSGVDGEHDDLVMALCLTEEMDVALGPYQAPDEDYSEPIRVDDVTGYPIY